MRQQGLHVPPIGCDCPQCYELGAGPSQEEYTNQFLSSEYRSDGPNYMASPNPDWRVCCPTHTNSIMKWKVTLLPGGNFHKTWECGETRQGQRCHFAVAHSDLPPMPEDGGMCRCGGTPEMKWTLRSALSPGLHSREPAWIGEWLCAGCRIVGDHKYTLTQTSPDGDTWLNWRDQAANVHTLWCRATRPRKQWKFWIRPSGLMSLAHSFGLVPPSPRRSGRVT